MFQRSKKSSQIPASAYLSAILINSVQPLTIDRNRMDQRTVSFNNDLGCAQCLTNGYTYVYKASSGASQAYSTATSSYASTKCCYDSSCGSSSGSSDPISNYSAFLKSTDFANSDIALLNCPTQTDVCGTSNYFTLESASSSSNNSVTWTIDTGKIGMNDQCHFIVRTICDLPTVTLSSLGTDYTSGKVAMHFVEWTTSSSSTFSTTSQDFSSLYLGISDSVSYMSDPFNYVEGEFPDMIEYYIEVANIDYAGCIASYSSTSSVYNPCLTYQDPTTANWAAWSMEQQQNQPGYDSGDWDDLTAEIGKTTIPGWIIQKEINDYNTAIEEYNSAYSAWEEDFDTYTSGLIVVCQDYIKYAFDQAGNPKADDYMDATFQPNIYWDDSSSSYSQVITPSDAADYNSSSSGQWDYQRVLPSDIGEYDGYEPDNLTRLWGYGENTAGMIDLSTAGEKKHFGVLGQGSNSSMGYIYPEDVQSSSGSTSLKNAQCTYAKYLAVTVYPIAQYDSSTSVTGVLKLKFQAEKARQDASASSARTLVISDYTAEVDWDSYTESYIMMIQELHHLHWAAGAMAPYAVTLAISTTLVATSLF